MGFFSDGAVCLTVQIIFPNAIQQCINSITQLRVHIVYIKCVQRSIGFQLGKTYVLCSDCTRIDKQCFGNNCSRLSLPVTWYLFSARLDTEYFNERLKSVLWYCTLSTDGRDERQRTLTNYRFLRSRVAYARLNEENHLNLWKNIKREIICAAKIENGMFPCSSPPPQRRCFSSDELSLYV